MKPCSTFESSAGPTSGLALGTVAGFVFSFRVAITYLWFQSAPQLGTMATITLSVILLFAAIWTALITHHSAEPRKPNPGIRAVGAYLALSGTSLLWSSTRSVPVAAVYWAGNLADVSAVLLLLRSSAADCTIIKIFRGYVLGAMVVAAIAWATPPRYDLRLGDEDFLHPNAIGFVLAIATLLAMYLAHDRPRWRWAAAVVSVTLFRTLSKACIAACLLAATVYLLYGMKLSRRSKITIATVVIGTVVAFWGVIEAYSTFYSEGTTNLETLTGRTLIWAQSFEIAKEAPWLGHGFYSFRFIVPPFGEFEAWHAHNELLQQFFSFGVVGVLVTILLYYTLFQQIRKSDSRALRSLAGSLLLFAFVRGLVDTERFDLSFPLWLIAAFSIVLTGRVPQRQLTK